MAKKKLVAVTPKVWAVLIRMIRDYLAGRLTNRPPGEDDGTAAGGGGRLRFGYTTEKIEDETEGLVQPYVWRDGEEAEAGEPVKVYSAYGTLGVGKRVTFGHVGGRREVIQAKC